MWWEDTDVNIPYTQFAVVGLEHRTSNFGWILKKKFLVVPTILGNSFVQLTSVRA